MHLSSSSLSAALSACRALCKERDAIVFAIVSKYTQAAAMRHVGFRRCALLERALQFAETFHLDNSAVVALMARQGLRPKRALAALPPIRCGEVVLAQVAHTTDAGAFAFLPGHDGWEAIIGFSDLSGGDVRRAKVRSRFEALREQQALFACRVQRFDPQKQYVDLLCNLLHRREHVVTTPGEEAEARRRYFRWREAGLVLTC